MYTSFDEKNIFSRCKSTIEYVALSLSLDQFFFNSRRRSWARFFQKKWTFKAYKYKTLYMSDQAFYMWNLLYINKSSDERSIFIVVSNTEFMKNSQSWTFARDFKKNFVIRFLCFSESNLRSSDVKTASRLIRIDLAYHVN